jgi:histidyl-tRNA synthetase
LKSVLSNSEIGLKGVAEMQEIIDYLQMFDLQNEVELDLTLARGLNYYTGTIFEVKANDVQIGSICGGGRYDDLTGIFGLKDVSGVGISFGADRIFDVLNELDLYPKHQSENTKVFFVNFGKAEEIFCLPILAKLRKAGVNAEIYPEATKMKKQMKFANDKAIPFVVIIGEDEMQKGELVLKNMESGEQKFLSIEELLIFMTK